MTLRDAIEYLISFFVLCGVIWGLFSAFSTKANKTEVVSRKEHDHFVMDMAQNIQRLEIKGIETKKEYIEEIKQLQNQFDKFNTKFDKFNDTVIEILREK